MTTSILKAESMSIAAFDDAEHICNITALKKDESGTFLKRHVSESELTASTDSDLTASVVADPSLDPILDSYSVSFSTIQVREFERIVDERPEVTGPALAIGWDYNQLDDVEVDEHEDRKMAAKLQNIDAEEDDIIDNNGKGKDSIMPLSSFARGTKFLSYGFEHEEIKTESQLRAEALAKVAKALKLEEEERKKYKKLSYRLKSKVKKALR